MNNGKNSVTLRGKIGNEVELRHTEHNNTPVCNIRLCVTESWTNKQGEKQESELWITCVGWGLVAQEMNKFTKDQYVQVEGKISNRMRIHEAPGAEPFQYPVTEVKVATIFPIE